MYIKGKWLIENIDMLYYTGALYNEKLTTLKPDKLYLTTLTDKDMELNDNISIDFCVEIGNKWFKAYTY